MEQQTVEIGAIILSSIGMIGGIIMALVKTIEKNGSVIKCHCCCGKCECDLRQAETRQMVAQLELEKEKNKNKCQNKNTTTRNSTVELEEISLED